MNATDVASAQSMRHADRLLRILHNPPKEFSPAPIWWWSGDPLEIDRLRWQMDRFVEGGVYNLVLLNLAPTGPLYGSDPDKPRFFSDEWWEIFNAVCAYAEQIGISIWFYDQIGFSGANLQGEIVRENPEYAGRWLESITVEGDGSLELACPYNGEPLAAGAVKTDGDGNAVGDVIPVPIIEGRALFEGKGRHRLRLAYVIERGFDYFNAGACRRLLDTVYGEYEKRASQYFGKSIAGSFQDELPSLPSWSRDFLARFRQRWGYSIEPLIIALWEMDDEKSRQVRVHYHRLRAELAEEALFKPMFDWHEKHGLTCGFDQQSPSRAGEPKATVRQYADYFATHRWYQAPGSDHHGDAKIHSSMAHLYGRKRVWIEAFHSSGWGGTIEETFDWLLPWFRAGATLYNPHAVYYSTRGGWWEWAPPSTCWRQPYWRHYRQMSDAVSRVCALLSQGHHVCDIGLLFPTTTIQAGLTPDGATAWADRAHQIYNELVGVMHWQKPTPGVFDQDRRDYDVLDDASVQRGLVSDGGLTIGAEHFKVIVLPGCTVLEANTARVLLQFVRAGGKLIVIGSLPHHVLDDKDGRLLASVRHAAETGRITLVERATDVPDALADHPRIVDAAVPTLLRRVGDAHVLFVPGAFPYATVHRNHHGQQVHYEFDPQTYARSMTVTVQGVKGRAQVWDVVTGKRTPIRSIHTGNGVEVNVSFDSGPMALVVWTDDQDVDSDAALGSHEQVIQQLPDEWSATIEPTIDNRFGDFTKPNSIGSFPVQTWYFWHRIDEHGDFEDSGDIVGQSPAGDDRWSQVHATFGVYGRFTGPTKEKDLPALGSSVESLRVQPGRWREATYSLCRGIDHDPLHYNTLGPKAHVPEEFLRFGPVKKGEGIQFCTSVWICDSTLKENKPIYLALAAPAKKEIWINGQQIDVEDNGYLLLTPIPLKVGNNTLEWRLVMESGTSDLRSYWALVTCPDEFRRPEWITHADEPRRDSMLKFSTRVHLPFQPAWGVVQLGADAPGRVIVNGIEQGRQGGFDPYHVTERVQPYDITGLHEGDNEIVVEIQDVGRPAAILVDALIQGKDGQGVFVISGSDWKVSRDDSPKEHVALRRRQWIDPAWSHLWRRPHPLPEAMWIEESPSLGPVLPIVPNAFLHDGRVEWFKWILPPGASSMEIPVQGEARLWVDAQEVGLTKLESSLWADLPDPNGLHRVATLKVVPKRGRTGGGVFTGPVSYESGTGKILLGAWCEQGLESYSGALRYQTQFELPNHDKGVRMILDLGRVRGTAEVHVNGVPVGVRVWSPYRFDVTDALTEGTNHIEVLVCNTLGPYLKAASPTPYIFPGQELSGMLGPVRLICKGGAVLS